MKFGFDTKETARKYFNQLRQMFIDWNYLKFKSDKFNFQEENINSKLREFANA